ncbi:MAG: GIY-YIG nuclease family protein [Candidatus Gastranaerophilales bacterium]|nr:GIY-YIG nuclease family protein [Candidatus Gastranaerophilales bacterium]
MFNTLYCGITPDMKKRYKAHIEGKGAKYTKSHKPKGIMYVDILEDKSSALKEEYKIKKTLSRLKKMELINKNKEKTEEILKKLDMAEFLQT